MSSDGAEQKVRINEALGVVVGGDDPDSVTPLSPEGFEEMIRNAPFPPWDLPDEKTDGVSAGYELAANATARLILETFETYPQTKSLPVERGYLRGSDNQIIWDPKPPFPILIYVDLWDVVKPLYPEHHETFLADLTGFMWGWAVNAARSILGLDPVPNPAIITIGLDGDPEQHNLDELVAEPVDLIVEVEPE